MQDVADPHAAPVEVAMVREPRTGLVELSQEPHDSRAGLPTRG